MKYLMLGVLCAVFLAGCQRPAIQVKPLAEGGSMPLSMWVEAVEQPGFEEMKRGETEHAYWAVFGNPRGFVHVAFEARTVNAAGSSAVVSVERLHAAQGAKQPERGVEVRTTRSGKVDSMPSRPWRENVGTIWQVPVGAVNQVPADYEGELRVLAVVDGYKTLVDTTVWWPPGSLPVALSPVPLDSE